jgi:hypothetical protein
VNTPFEPTQSGAGEVNVDVGGAVTVIDWVDVPGEQAPLEGETFNVTEYVPGTIQVAVTGPSIPTAGVVDPGKLQFPVPAAPPTYVKVAG